MLARRVALMLIFKLAIKMFITAAPVAAAAAAAGYRRRFSATLRVLLGAWLISN